MNEAKKLQSLQEEFIELKALVIELSHQNESMRQRLSMLEAQRIPTRNLRSKAKRILGFTISIVNGYYNAVRVLNKNRMAIYLGKNIEDEKAVAKKIIKKLVAKKEWYGDIRLAEDLMAIEEIQLAVISKPKPKQERKSTSEQIVKVDRETGSTTSETGSTTSETVEKICGFNINKYIQSQSGTERYSARLKIGNSQFNISLPPGWNKGVAKMRIVEYLTDENRKEYLDLYKDRYPEYAAELGIDR